MQLFGHNGSHCVAQVTEEAIEDYDGFSGVLPWKFASLIYDP